MTRLRFVFAALVVFAAACGEVQLTPELEQTIERREGLNAIDFQSGLTASEETCMEGSAGQELVREVVYDGTEVGDEARTRFMQGILDCLDDPSSWSGFVDVVIHQTEAVAGVPVELTRDEVSCYLDRLISRASDPARLLAIGDTPDAQDLFAEAMSNCFTAENLAILTFEDSPFEDYGDDTDRDDLHDRCGDGNLVACDLLWMISAVGTGYEAYAEMCGGNPVTTDWCSGIEPDEGLIASESDPVLVELVAACQDRDFIACDLAYVLAPIGGESEEIAFRCGDLVGPAGLGRCRDIDRGD